MQITYNAVLFVKSLWLSWLVTCHCSLHASIFVPCEILGWRRKSCGKFVIIGPPWKILTSLAPKR